MMEFKGTKGIWSLPHFADNNCTCDCGFVLVEGHCGAVATVHYSKDNSVENGDNPLPQQAIANAKLIAAAPELLEALQAAIIELEMYVPVTDAKVLQKAYAAINKALKD